MVLLIHTQRGVESLHQVRVTMTFATVSRNVQRPWLSQVTFSWVLRGFTGGGIRIAAMTVVAREAATTMYVVFKELGGRT